MTSIVITYHTPGPWKFEPDFGEVQAMGGEMLIAYAATQTSSRFDSTDLGVPDWDEMAANGRLIAAAPRMETTLNLVREVRAAQKRYFKERTQSALVESKRLEKELDMALAANWDNQR